jgi:hypothetical protein
MNMFGNLEFGPVKYNLSHLGIALKNASGEIVSYDKNKNEIVNVDLIDFNAENMIYAMPCAIKDIKKGDVIRHTNGNAVFVTSTENGIHVVDVAAGEKKEILPTKSMFGFDFVTKIVSFIDFGSMNASADQPFGNMLPFMFMANGKMDNGNMLLPFMMMNGGTMGTLDFNNPAMMMMLMASMGGSESKNFFPMLMLTQMFQKPNALPQLVEVEKQIQEK